MHYSPDDVELWLVDYKKVEFSEYIKNTPPHVTLISLEKSLEFTYSMLDYVKGEGDKRFECFKEAGVKNFSEYRKKYPDKKCLVLL